MDAAYAFVAEFAGSETRVRTIAYFGQDRLLENVEWDLAGTPCEEVVKGNLCHHPAGVSRKFPADEPLVRMGIESYLGVPLVAPDGKHLGHLAVFDPRPMPDEPGRAMIFRIFAARAAAELARLRVEQRLLDSEKQYHDLFDEAPIAYVQEDLESRFLSANRAAMRILGIAPEEVPRTVGISLVPDTPDAQRAASATRLNRSAAGPIPAESSSSCVARTTASRSGSSGGRSRSPTASTRGRCSSTSPTACSLSANKRRLKEQNLYLQEEIKADPQLRGDRRPEPGPRPRAGERPPGRSDRYVGPDLRRDGDRQGTDRPGHPFQQPARDKPLIKINCAALPAGLVESELFGHEKGAFTGAIARRIGRFELADGGTIFLDEIGEIPLDVQVKLLRVLQEQEFDRVGGKSPITVDVRVIAATNRNLLAAVREKTFREDLYYRLNVFPVLVPPLRERQEDIPLLTHFLVNKFATRIGKAIHQIAGDAMARLEAYHWPGNVRELENIVERAVILAEDSVLDIDLEVLPDFQSGAGGTAVSNSSEAAASSLVAVERDHIRLILEQTGGVIEGPSGAAKILELHPNTLRSRMKKLGIGRGDSLETARGRSPSRNRPDACELPGFADGAHIGGREWPTFSE